jgi:hypothetical protein
LRVDGTASALEAAAKSVNDFERGTLLVQLNRVPFELTVEQKRSDWLLDGRVTAAQAAGSACERYSRMNGRPFQKKSADASIPKPRKIIRDQRPRVRSRAASTAGPVTFKWPGEPVLIVVDSVLGPVDSSAVLPSRDIA